MITYLKLPKNRRNVFKVLISIFIILVMVVIVIYPDRYLESALNGIKLWCFSVLPSLLPFFFLTALLTRLEILSLVFLKANKFMKSIFNLSGYSLYAFSLSIISGYPVGSKTVTDLYLLGAINEGELKRATALCSTSGPLFIIGAVGVSMLSNKFYGFLLYAVHVICAVLTCLTFKNYGEKPCFITAKLKQNKVDDVLGESVYSSVISVLTVGGFISVFYVVCDVAFDFNLLTLFSKLVNFILSPFTSLNVGEGFVSGLIECTKGCYMLSKLPITPLTLSLISFLISFGGFSIIMQSLSYLKKAKISTRYFILVKLIHASYSFVLSLIIFSVLL